MSKTRFNRETTILKGITCKKIYGYTRDLACMWLIFEYAKDILRLWFAHKTAKRVL